MVTVCVVICTYDRPVLLADAVRTARGQALPAGVSAEILVVDNAPEDHARDAVTALGDGDGLPLRYLHAPGPNISLARNAGVAASDSDFVVFLDDDEWCEPGWLAALVATAQATGADVVFGQVVADFPDGPPAWDPSGRVYERRMDRADGSPMGIEHDARASGRWMGTGNSLLSRATCLAQPNPFDLRFGRTGGEDFDLFRRLAAAGRRMVWCGAAVVHEVVPADRTSFEYWLRRNRRGGQIYATITVTRAARPWLAAAGIGVRAAVQVPVVGVQLLAARAIGSRRAPDRRLKLAQAMGKLIWWPQPGHHH